MLNRSKWLVPGLALLLLCMLLRSTAAAGADAKPGDTGATIGTVREITQQYVLIGAPGELPQRHYFKSVGQPGGKADPETLAAAEKFHAGDWVEARWSYDDRLRLESVAAHAPVEKVIPEIKEPAKVETASGTAVANPTAAPLTTGEKVNGMIDNLLATGVRLLELPLFMLLGAAALVEGGLALLAGFISRKRKNPRLMRGVLIAEAAIGILCIAFLVDRKISRLQDEVNELRAKASANAIDQMTATTKKETAGGKRQSLLFDSAETSKRLAAAFGDVNLKPVVYDEATDAVQLHMNNPLIQAYLTVIDLRNPLLEIKLGMSLDRKTLTTDFSRANDCTVAINGEAGLSPAPGSGLGTWRGYMVKEGETLLAEDARVARPFLSFDRQNRASFKAASASARTLPAETYNAIWGRLDAVVDGVVQTGDERNRQPRTAMGINQDGTRLYLLVVDGRQPSYSNGFTRAEVGQCLKAFGAYNGMLCDEGGSSCMYLKQFGGICNIPSDNQGEERATYSHFGVALRPGS